MYLLLDCGSWSLSGWAECLNLLSYADSNGGVSSLSGLPKVRKLVDFSEGVFMGEGALVCCGLCGGGSFSSSSGIAPNKELPNLPRFGLEVVV